jgi:hypothetical protein
VADLAPAPSGHSRHPSKRTPLISIELLPPYTTAGRRDTARNDRRIQAAENDPGQGCVELSLRLQFGEREWQQVQKPHPPSERLGDACHQTKLLRARKHELPGRAPFVHPRLQIREQLGGALHLV